MQDAVILFVFKTDMVKNDFTFNASCSFVLLAGLQGLFTYISGRLAAKTSENTTRRLRNYLFDNIQHLPFSYHAETDTGELISSCTSDVDALRRY